MDLIGKWLNTDTDNVVCAWYAPQTPFLKPQSYQTIMKQSECISPFYMEEVLHALSVDSLYSITKQYIIRP